jgi:hypothetical protein
LLQEAAASGQLPRMTMSQIDLSVLQVGMQLLLTTWLLPP